MEQKSDIEMLKQQIEDQKKKKKKIVCKIFEYQSPSEMLDNLFSLGHLKRNEVSEKLAITLSIFLIKLKNFL